MTDCLPSPVDVARNPVTLAALCELWQDTDIWITLNGRSMMPTIRPGSRLRLRCDHELAVPGAVVAYRRGKDLIVHRLIRRVAAADGSEPRLEFQGDANNYLDAPILPEQVVGVVVEMKPPSFPESVRRIARSLARRCRRLARPAAPRVALRPEEEILLLCAGIHLDEAGALRIRALLRMEVDWDRLGRLAQQHGLHLLLYHHLNSLPLSPGGQTFLAAQQMRFHVGVMRGEYLTEELLSLLALFAAHDIEAVPYKGPALAAAAYGDPALRPCGDLDLLIRPADVLRAKELLLAQGYKSEHCFQSDAEETRRLQTDCEYNFLRPRDGLVVELHWRFRPEFFPFSLDMEALWDRRQTILLAGVPIPAFPPEDLLLILCVHGAKHCWERLMWVCDIAELIRARPDIDWEQVTAQAADLGCMRVLLLGLLLARDLLAAPVPEAVLSRMPTVVRSLAVQVRRQIAEGESSRFARSLFHWNIREHLRDRMPYLQDRFHRESGFKRQPH